MPIEHLNKPKNFYDILEIVPGAGDQEVKRAYRRLALQHHPDRPGLLNRRAAEIQFRQINEAYAHLKTAQKRAQYNDSLRAQNDNGHKPSNFWEVVFDIFKRPAERP